MTVLSRPRRKYNAFKAFWGCKQEFDIEESMIALNPARYELETLSKRLETWPKRSSFFRPQKCRQSSGKSRYECINHSTIQFYWWNCCLQGYSIIIPLQRPKNNGRKRGEEEKFSPVIMSSASNVDLQRKFALSLCIIWESMSKGARGRSRCDWIQRLDQERKEWMMQSQVQSKQVIAHGFFVQREPLRALSDGLASHFFN